MAGKIQDQDIKSAAELVSAGATAASLPNDTKIYVTANGINDTLANAITNGQIGSGGGGINYIPSQISQGKTVTGITTYLDSTPGAAPTGSVSGASVSTLVSSTDSTLVSTTNLLWTKSANNRQGEGFYIPFTIDAAYKSKPFTVSLIYSVNSGTFASGDQTIWIQDVTNSTFIQPTGSSILNSIGATVQTATFQAASNSTSYRIYVHTSTVSALAYSLRYDSISVGPNTYNFGAVVTDDKLVTLSPSASFGTTTLQSTWVKRVGDMAIFRGTFKVGTATAAAAQFGLPSGYTIDSSKFASTSNSQKIGTFQRMETGAGGALAVGEQGPIFYDGSDTANLYLAIASASNQLTKANASTIFNANDSVTYQFEVPILGWGTSQVLSSDTDTRVVAASYILTAGTVTPGANTQVNFDTKLYDTHGAVTTGVGSWKLTVPVPGYYAVKSMFFYSSGTTGYPTLCVNGVQTYYGTPLTATTQTGLINIDLLLKAGDILDVRPTSSMVIGGSSLPYQGFFMASRLSGPAQVAASEKVYCQYTGNAGTALTADVTNVDFATKVVDSHGAWNGTTFTAPRPGWFDVKGSWSFTTAAGRSAFIWLNTVKKLNINTTATTVAISSLAGGVYMNAGDTLTIRSDVTGALSNSALLHWIAITSQG